MRFSVASDFASCHEVQQAIMGEIERLGYCEAARFAIKLSLEEAIVNAIKHGNKFDRGKRVFVEAELSHELTRVTVEDQGDGFQRTYVPDPRADENLEKCSGRGILLIEAYMTGVEWGNQGRRLIMWRRNEPDGHAQ